MINKTTITMSDSDNVIETVQGCIKIVKYNKPLKKNAIDVNMYVRITEILDEAASDDSITVAVLTGVGTYYSSGNDLTARTFTHEKYDTITVLKRFIEAFINFPKLLIAIVNGPAIGIAATTLPLCDLVFASENAFFYTPFTKLGIIPEGCSTYTFPRLVGDRKAAELLMFNYKMSAQEALECGFVNSVYKPEEIQAKVWDKIIEISKLPKHSLLASKKIVRNQIRDDLLNTNAKELEELEKVLSSEEYMNSLLKFINRKSKL